jgi:ferredoxin
MNRFPLNFGLKALRVRLALLFFAAITLYFVDFRQELPTAVAYLLHLQIIPALLAGTVGIWLLHVALALLLGRIYCSVICPAGVLQDIVGRLWWMGKKRSKQGRFRFRYHKPYNRLRYLLMAVAFGLLAAGVAGGCLLLDPYSNFGRLAANLFRPPLVWVNNMLVNVLGRWDNYSLYPVPLTTVTSWGIFAALAILALWTFMTAWRGRLFCNTLCPVGAGLSLFSRFSLFRVQIDREKCNACGLCAKACKAEAIDSDEGKIDTSRCVDCFNCLSVCRRGAIGFRRHYLRNKAEESHVSGVGEGPSRRAFLGTSAKVVISLPVVTLPAVAAFPSGTTMARNPITPPGSQSLERFKSRCTACHICVVHCPSRVLRPAGLEFGWSYVLKPHMAYTDSYCNYECTVCADVCPNRAIALPDGTEEKVTTQVGVAVFTMSRCIVQTENTDCGACSEHCPTQAVHMVPYREGSTLTIPQVEAELCIGCGGCESICPVRPLRAIAVQANLVHRSVSKPVPEEATQVEISDFGF